MKQSLNVIYDGDLGMLLFPFLTLLMVSCVFVALETSGIVECRSSSHTMLDPPVVYLFLYRLQFSSVNYQSMLHVIVDK